MSSASSSTSSGSDDSDFDQPTDDENDDLNKDKGICRRFREALRASNVKVHSKAELESKVLKLVHKLGGTETLKKTAKKTAPAPAAPPVDLPLPPAVPPVDLPPARPLADPPLPPAPRPEAPPLADLPPADPVLLPRRPRAGMPVLELQEWMPPRARIIKAGHENLYRALIPKLDGGYVERGRHWGGRHTADRTEAQALAMVFRAAWVVHVELHPEDPWPEWLGDRHGPPDAPLIF